MRFSVGVDLDKHQMTVHIKDGKGQYINFGVKLNI